MKYVNKNYWLILLTLIFISGCTPSALEKEDIRRTAYETREEVLALQDKDPMDPGGLSLIESKNEGLKRSIVEIQGNQKGVKFIDESWQDYPIWLNLNVVPLRTFFALLEELTGLNFIIGDEVTGDISIKLNNVNWVEVFEMVMREKNLIHDVNPSGSVITVHTYEVAGEQSASYEKALDSKIKVINSLSSLDTKTTAIFKLNYTKPEVLSKQLTEVISTLEAGGEGEAADKRASFVIDTRTNSLIVQASPADMEWIKTTIDSLDKPTKQVMVEVFIVEATDTFQEQLGSRVSMFASKIGGADALNRTSVTGIGGTPPTAMGNITNAAAGGSIATNTISDPKGGIIGTFLGNSTELRVELQAMQDESLIKIVSNPKLFIIDNESASIEDGQEVPYSLAAAAGATPTTAFKNATLKMSVTPSIIPDGNIYLDIEVNNDSVAATSSGTPSINKKAIKTKLLVTDGGVAMIGGINKATDSTTKAGVPLLSDIPILGNLFKSTADKKQKNILYIFIAPKVL
jgi:type IV pilus assembly protein PilQ